MIRRSTSACAPPIRKAALAFDALEEARVDAIGGGVMLGVRRNVSARAEQQAHTGQQDVALPAALSFLLRREALGVEPPEDFQETVARWRNEIAGKAEGELSALLASLADQQAFAAREALLRALDLITEPGSDHTFP